MGLNKKNILLLIFTVVFIGTSLSGEEFNSIIMGDRKLTTPSDKKIIDIEKVVKRSFEQDTKSTDYDAIKNAVIEEVKAIYPLSPRAKVKKINFSKIEKNSDEKAGVKYPLNVEQLESKYKKEAVEKYIPAEIGDKLTVKYKIGRNKLVTYTGIYSGLNRFHNGVRIGHEIIPVFDLLPEYKARFVKKFREMKIDSYVKDNIKKYISDKDKYAVQLITASIKEIGKDNEEAGYINAWHEWRSPEEVAEKIYNFYLVKIMKEKKQTEQKEKDENK